MSRADDLVELEGGLAAVRGLNNAPITADKVLAAHETGVLLVDASAGAVTITLPAASRLMDVRVQRVDNSGNRLVIQAAGGETVKFHTRLRPAGYGFFVLMGAGDFWHLRSDGAGAWVPLDRLDAGALGRPIFETSTALSPGGWGLPNGALLNRADWPWLWDYAQQSGMLVTEAARVGMEGAWTGGDGATTFRLPELRGEFLRVLDEGRGVDASRVAGSWQDGTWLRTIAQEWSGADVVGGPHMIGNAYAQPDGFMAQPPGTPMSPSGARSPGGNAFPIIISDNAITGSAVGESDQTINVWIRMRSRNLAYPGRIKLI